MSLTIQNIVLQIFRQYDIDILLDGNRFCALIEDLAPEMKLEKKVIHRLNQDQLLKDIYTLFCNTPHKESEYGKLDILLDDAGFSDSWKQVVYNIFDPSIFNSLDAHDNVADGADDSTSNIIQLSEIDDKIDDFLDRIFSEGTSADPIVDIKKARTPYYSISLSMGMKIDFGFDSTGMSLIDNSEKIILIEPYILITKERITNAQIVIRLLELVKSTRRSLLIVAPYLDEESLGIMVQKDRTVSNAFLKVPIRGCSDLYFNLSDITDGSVIYDYDDDDVDIDIEYELNHISLDRLGQATRVIIYSDETIIINRRTMQFNIEE